MAGPGICDAYAAPWQPREKILRDGWFVTGDLGQFDADGFLFLLSRKTAVINLAGRKVFPEEIEAVLNRHPAVSESRVFGRVHPHLGEVVEAEIVLIRRRCRHRKIFRIFAANIWPPTKFPRGFMSFRHCRARR